MTQTKIPLSKLMLEYDMSKTTVYSLIEQQVLIPLYFRGSSTKPFFDIQQVEAALVRQPNGGVKRKKTS